MKSITAEEAIWVIKKGDWKNYLDIPHDNPAYQQFFNVMDFVLSVLREYSHKWDDNARYVADTLSYESILMQLAEEASELSAAATKMARIEIGENPSPKSYYEAKTAVWEEYNDVICSKIVLELQGDKLDDKNQQRKKLERWMQRLKDKKQHNGV